MSIEWIATSIGPSGTVYFDMVVNGCLMQDAWIAEFNIGGVRKWSFRRREHEHTEHWFPTRDTFDEAKEDAAKYFAERELEKH